MTCILLYSTLMEIKGMLYMLYIYMAKGIWTRDPHNYVTLRVSPSLELTCFSMTIPLFIKRTLPKFGVEELYTTQPY